MKLSIIIPVHNEEAYLKQTLDKIFLLPLSYDKEIIVINDGSTDNTQKILEQFQNKVNFKILKHEKNLGKGAAIKTGVKESTGDLIIIQDADLEYNPKDIPLLLNEMHINTAVVCGKRGSKRWPKRGFHYVLGAKILTETINILYGTKLTDTYTGYKLFNMKIVDKNLFKNLQSTGFEFEAEIICKILNQKGKIIEIPISYTPRSKEEGKQIKLQDAFKGFFTILKCFLCARLGSNQRPYP